MPAKISYLYLKQSHPQQAPGDANRRIQKSAEIWAKTNGYELRPVPPFGLSASKKSDALDSITALVVAGEIPKSSVLLIDTIDSLERGKPLEMAEKFSQLTQIGITITTLCDGRSYKAEPLADLVTKLLEINAAERDRAFRSQRIRAGLAARKAKKKKA